MTDDRGSGSALEQLRELASRLRRDDKVERRLLAGVIQEARRRKRAGDRAFSNALTSALLVESLVWIRDAQETVEALAAGTRAEIEKARDGVTRVYDEEIGPQVERAIIAELKQRELSAKGAARKRQRAAETREKLLRGDTVHLSDRQKRRLLRGK